MANTYQYCVATNWGKGFIDHDESWRITFKSYPGNVWQVPAYNKHANLWIAKVAGTVKTKDEAQAIVTAEVNAAKTAWDNNNVSGESSDEKIDRLGDRPTDITLEAQNLEINYGIIQRNTRNKYSSSSIRSI